MKKIIRAAAAILFFLGIVSAANAFFPGTTEKLKELAQKVFLKKPAPEELAAEEARVKNILGRLTSRQTEEGTVSQEVVEGIKQLPQKILSQEVVQEITAEVNQLINQKVEETKKLPQKGMEKTKEEIRRQMYQEICEDWLKDKEQE